MVYEKTAVKDKAWSLRDMLYEYSGDNAVVNDGKAVLCKGDILFLRPDDGQGGPRQFVSSRGAVLDYDPGSAPCKKLLPEGCDGDDIHEALMSFSEQAAFKDAPMYLTDKDGNQAAAFPGSLGSRITVTQKGGRTVVGQVYGPEADAMGPGDKSFFNSNYSHPKTVSEEDFQEAAQHGRSPAGRVSSVVRKISGAPEPYIPSAASGVDAITSYMGVSNLALAFEAAHDYHMDELRAAQAARQIEPGMVLSWWTRSDSPGGTDFRNEAVALGYDAGKGVRIAPVYETKNSNLMALIGDDAVDLPQKGPFLNDGPKVAVPSAAYDVSPMDFIENRMLIVTGGPVDEGVLMTIQGRDPGKDYPETPSPRHAGAAERMKAMQSQEQAGEPEAGPDGSKGWDGEI